MNAQTKIVADMTVDQAHVFRSKLLDSFSEAERAVITLVALMPKKPSDGACLKQQIDHAKGIQPSPKLSKDKRDKVLNSLDRLAVLLMVRADIVHARLQIAHVDSCQKLIFLNSRRANDPFPLVRMLTSADIQKLSKEVREIAAQIRSALTQPSLPPPKPAAAAGP